MRGTVKPADIARAVKGSTKEATLYVADEGDGTLWATQRYWIVPAERVAPLLAHHNLDVEAGSYDVNGRVSRGQQSAPRIATIIETARSESPALTRSLLSGQPAYVRLHADLLAMYETAAGAHVAVNSAYLDFVAAGVDAMGRGEVADGDVILRQPEPGKLVSVFVKVRRCEEGHKGADGVWVASTWHDAGERLLGAVMPVRLG